MGNLFQVINLVWFGAKLRTLQVLKWYWPKMEHVVFLKSFRATQKHSCETGDAISSYLFFFLDVSFAFSLFTSVHCYNYHFEPSRY